MHFFWKRWHAFSGTAQQANRHVFTSVNTNNGSKSLERVFWHVASALRVLYYGRLWQGRKKKLSVIPTGWREFMGLNGKIFVSSQRVSSVKCFIFLWMQSDSSPAVSKLFPGSICPCVVFKIISHRRRLLAHLTFHQGRFNTWLSQSTPSNIVLFCWFISGYYCNLGFLPCNSFHKVVEMLIPKHN